MYIRNQSEENKKDSHRIIERFEKMSSKRMNFETHWQECMDYIIPRKGEITTKKTPGDKRNNELFDSTAITSNLLLSAALHGMLTNPATRFFELIFDDPMLDGDVAVRNWLDEVGDKMFVTLNNSNFQTEIHEIYLDLGAIGTACLYMGDDDETVVHFAARPIKEIYIDENNKGLIDTVYRHFKWKPRQIVQEFGAENLPEEIVEEHKKGCDDEWDIIHTVEPADMYASEPSYFAYKSCYVLKEYKFKFAEKGYREFPYAVPRWTKTSGEVYGRGPGMDTLPDTKMVNRMMETVLKGAQKTVDPPLMVADDGVIGNVRLTPGGLTVIRPGSDVPIRPLITDARIDFGYQAVEDVRKRIRSGFFVDQMNLSQNDRMTTVEVQQRIQEGLRFMGPTLGRQHFELLKQVVERVFGIMNRKNLIPPAPESIIGKNFKVRYSSQVARAQRMSEGQNFTQAINTLAPIANADPKVLDNLDSDKLLKYIFEIMGVPARVLRTDREVQELRQGREQAQAQAAQEQQQMHQAEVASKVGPAAAQVMQAAKR